MRAGENRHVLFGEDMTEEQATQQLIYLEQAVFLLQATAVSTAIGVGILTWLLVRISIKGLWD